jgi:tetratricopeptide (TPR) repeat protein
MKNSTPNTKDLNDQLDVKDKLRRILIICVILSHGLDSLGQTVDTHFRNAQTKYRTENYNGAIRDLNKSIAANPTDKAYVLRGLAKMKRQKRDPYLAIDDFNEALVINDTCIRALVNRGVCKIMIGGYSEAESDFTKVIELRPNSLKGYQGRMSARKAMNNLAGAAADQKILDELLGKPKQETSSNIKSQETTLKDSNLREDVQDKNSELDFDLIILHNGDDIEGRVLEVSEGTIKYRKASNIDGPIYTTDKSLVFMIRYKNGSKDVFDGKELASTKMKEYQFKYKGFTNITSFVIGFGVGGSTNDISLGFSNSIGYLVNPYFSFGIGSGLDVYRERLMIPLFVDLRANFIKKRVSPLFSIGLGYSFTPRKDLTTPDGLTYSFRNSRGGFYLNPALGVRFFVSKKTALYLSLGFRLQDFDVRRNESDSWNRYRTTYLTTKFGIVF